MVSLTTAMEGLWQNRKHLSVVLVKEFSSVYYRERSCLGGDYYFTSRCHPLCFSVGHHSKCHTVCWMDLLSTQTGNDINVLEELELTLNSPHVISWVCCSVKCMLLVYRSGQRCTDTCHCVALMWGHSHCVKDNSHVHDRHLIAWSFMHLTIEHVGVRESVLLFFKLILSICLWKYFSCFF